MILILFFGLFIEKFFLILQFLQLIIVVLYIYTCKYSYLSMRGLLF